jgi:photosystem II stability/assembly factor-like uncharacterized protein
MKKSFYLFFLTCFIFSTAYTQWQFSNPQPSGYANTKVVFVSNDTGYIMNTRGDLIQTVDGGNRWKIIRNFQFAQVMEIKHSTGIIADYRGLSVSTDNGLSWNRKATLPSVVRIDIISRDTVFAVVDNNFSNSLYKSFDRGNTWQKINVPVNTIKGEDFIDGKTGCISSHTGMYRTADGGVTWDTVYKTYNTLAVSPVRFFDNKNGFAYWDQDKMIQTTDGGITWTLSAGVNDRIFDIFYLNEQTAFATSEGGVIYRTTNKGASWSASVPTAASYAYALYSSYFLNAMKGFAVGSRGRILKSNDGGVSWENYAPSYVDIMGLSLPGNNVGYAVSWYDLLKTTDGGKNWDTLPFKTQNGNWFKFLHFFNRDTGIIIQDQPVRIHQTTNGGLNWNTVDLRSLGFLYYDTYTSCYIVNSVIYLTATGGYPHGVLRSRDFGKTWEEVSNVYPANYQNLHFTTEKTGYGTMAASLFRTQDSGKTWSRVHTADISFINSVWFTDEKTGWAAGDNALLLQTQDSGKSWNRVTINNNNNGRDNLKIKFFNAQVGYITQEQGGVLITADSGRTWLQHGTPAAYDCRFIEFSADSTIHLGGIYGTIVNRKIVTHQVDSLMTHYLSNCKLSLSARVTAVLSTVDSIFFEYGVTGYDSSIKASPGQVTNASVKVNSPPIDLLAASTHKFRVKVYYQGNIYYTDSVNYISSGSVNKPVISVSANVLSSSSPTANQWYLNGIPIPGATGHLYTPAQAGIYSVSVTQNGCSVMSESFNFLSTGVTDPAAWNNEVIIFPNPVAKSLQIKNTSGRALTIRLLDVDGRQVYHETTSGSSEINMQPFAKGSYILVVTDKRKNLMMTKLVVKQ